MTIQQGTPPPDATAEHATTGGRGPAVVARRFSLQARVQNALALGVVALVGGGFLAWYYTGLAESRAEVKQVKPAAVQGEMKLPPLGPAPPVAKPPVSTTLVEEDSAEALALLAATEPSAGRGETGYAAVTAGGAYAAPPPPDPVLQRKLGSAVLLRGLGGYGAGAEDPDGADALASGRGLDGARDGRRPEAAGLAGGGSGVSGMGGMLRPTVMPATAAGVLPERRFLLPRGAFIDCTLETAIDSTLPGMTTCVTATDVWSADGAVVLLERGTKLVGETRGGMSQGSRRLFVLWNEARTPTGVVVPLASPGTDALGRSGVTGAVDTQFAARFGAAILISTDRCRGGGAGGGTERRGRQRDRELTGDPGRGE